nr:MAG TPA: hypothetical protein [Bacteriophage sp.]
MTKHMSFYDIPVCSFLCATNSKILHPYKSIR